MPGLLNPLSKSFDDIKSDMLAQIPALAPSWTNLNDTDPGIALVTLVAGATEMLAYYLDRYTDEVFLPTALTRAAIQRLTALIDYRLSRPTAATTTLRFSLPGAPAVAPILIPQFTVVETTDGIPFTTKTDATLFIGDQFVDVVAFQGAYQTESFTGTGTDVQRFTLARPNVAQNFLEVFVDNVRWTEDDNATLPGTPAVYEVNTDEAEAATLRFAGFLGSVPRQSASVRTHYVETLGDAGNLGAGVIKRIITAIAGGDALTVTNTASATGGKARESLDEARFRAPRRLRTLDRAVTLKDFEDLLLGNLGVAAAQAINHNGYAEIYVAAPSGARFYVLPPTGVTLAATGSGSTFAGTTYYVRVTATDANGETDTVSRVPSTGVGTAQEWSITLTAGQNLQVTIPATAGAVSYNVYVGTVSGTVRLAGTVAAAGSGATVTTLAAPPSGSAALAPTANTTGARLAGTNGSLKVAADAHLEQRRLIGTTFALFNATPVSIDVTATVKVFENYRQTDVKGRVEAALAGYFAFGKRAFAEDVALSDLYALLMDVEGVRSVGFVAPAGDTTINDGQLAVLGTTALTMTGGTP